MLRDRFEQDDKKAAEAKEEQEKQDASPKSTEGGKKFGQDKSPWERYLHARSSTASAVRCLSQRMYRRIKTRKFAAAGCASALDPHTATFLRGVIRIADWLQRRERTPTSFPHPEKRQLICQQNMRGRTILPVSRGGAVQMWPICWDSVQHSRRGNKLKSSRSLAHVRK